MYPNEKRSGSLVQFEAKLLAQSKDKCYFRVHIPRWLFKAYPKLAELETVRLFIEVPNAAQNDDPEVNHYYVSRRRR